jgi:site-specific DNA recombinase
MLIQYVGQKFYTHQELMDLADKIKAIVYARVSTGDQVDRYSLESQVERCVAHLQAKYGYSEDEIICLIEEGVSGDNPNRPSLQHGLFLIENGVGRKFTVLHPDRLARDLGLQTVISQRVWGAGADLEFVEMHLDKDNPESMFMYNVQGAVAAYNKQKILANSKRGRRQMVRKGKIPGLNKKFGYIFDKDLDTLVEHPEQKETYLMMVDLLLNGLNGKKMSTTAIAEEMAARGREAAKGDSWNRSTVYRILSDESYTGRFFYGKTRVVQVHGVSKQVSVPREEWMMIPIPRYIDDLTYARIIRTLAENSTSIGGRKSTVGYLLKGLARCGRCGAAAAAAPVSSTKNTKRYYYGCTAKGKRAFKVGDGEPNQVCRGRNWRKDVVDELVWKYVVSCLQNPEQIIAEVVRKQGDMTYIDDLKQRSEMFEKRINDKQTERKKVVMLFTKGTIDEAEMNELLGPIDNTLNRLKEEYSNVLDRLQAVSMSFDEMEQIKQAIETFHRAVNFDEITFEGKRALVETFVSKVILCEDTIEIFTTWKPSPSGRSDGIGVKTIDRIPLSLAKEKLTPTHYNCSDGQGDGGSQERFCPDPRRVWL